MKSGLAGETALPGNDSGAGRKSFRILILIRGKVKKTKTRASFNNDFVRSTDLLLLVEWSKSRNLPGKLVNRPEWLSLC